METPNIFISSCTRRQLARRRPSRIVARAQLLLTAIVVVAAVAVFVGVRGGI